MGLKLTVFFACFSFFGQNFPSVPNFPLDLSQFKDFFIKTTP